MRNQISLHYSCIHSDGRMHSRCHAVFGRRLARTDSWASQPKRFSCSHQCRFNLILYFDPFVNDQKYGGPGGDILMASVFWDEQGYSGCWGPGFSIHSGVPWLMLLLTSFLFFLLFFILLYSLTEICLPYIQHYGSEAQVCLYWVIKAVRIEV